MTAGMGEQGRAIGGMSARAAALVAWSLCVLSLTLTALSLSLLTLTLFRRVDLDLVMGLDSGHRSRGVPRPAVPRWQVAQRSLAVWFAWFSIAAVIVGVALTALPPGPILQLPLQNPLCNRLRAS